jgi:hypothetical protein
MPAGHILLQLDVGCLLWGWGGGVRTVLLVCAVHIDIRSCWVCRSWHQQLFWNCSLLVSVPVTSLPVVARIAIPLKLACIPPTVLRMCLPDCDCRKLTSRKLNSLSSHSSGLVPPPTGNQTSPVHHSFLY